MEYNKDRPFLAKIKNRYPLTGEGSTKQVHHIVLDIAGSGIEYAVGDVVGVFPVHDSSILTQTLKALGATGNEEIIDKRSGQLFTLQDYLTSKINLTEVSRNFFSLIRDRLADPSHVEQLLHPDHKQELKEYIAKNDVWHLLEEFSEAKITPQELCDLAMPLLPRFYSIASSPYVSQNEIHLTVAIAQYDTKTGIRPGVCSNYLCTVAGKKTLVPIYLQKHKGFTIPEDPAAPIIMVGPGTGIAPFRAFIQERVKRGHQGKNWLLFGERNRKTDFYYEEELLNWEASGALKLDTAFSRDQENKIYVQHRMLDSSKEVFELLENGAYFYVCGDAQFMAKDVDLALHKLLQKEGSLSEEEAKTYVKNLRKEKRYLRDVY